MTCLWKCLLGRYSGDVAGAHPEAARWHVPLELARKPPWCWALHVTATSMAAGLEESRLELRREGLSSSRVPSTPSADRAHRGASQQSGNVCRVPLQCLGTGL